MSILEIRFQFNKDSVVATFIILFGSKMILADRVFKNTNLKLVMEECQAHKEQLENALKDFTFGIEEEEWQRNEPPSTSEAKATSSLEGYTSLP